VRFGALTSGILISLSKRKSEGLFFLVGGRTGGWKEEAKMVET
jgi:hypothetical protein